MKKIALTIAVYDRLEITRKCYEGIERCKPQFNKYGYDLDVYICGSFQQEHDDLAKEFGYKMYNHKNLPLSAKYRAFLKQVIELYDWDFWMLLGSDDFMTNDAAEIICKQMDSDFLAGMPKNIFYFETDKRKGFEFKNIARCGACRWYRREVIDKVHDQNLYPKDINKLLDGLSQKTIHDQTGVLPHRFEGSYVCDVKSSVNINSFDSLKKFLRIEDYHVLNISDYIPEFKEK